MARTSARNRPRNPGRSTPTPAAKADAPQRPPWYETARPAWIALAIAAAHLLLAVLAFNPRPFEGGDNGVYLALARALAERHAYVDLWDPALPAHTQYPPVWPGFLALLWMVGLHGFIVMKWAVVFFSACAVGLSYLWLRRTTTPGLALLAGALLAFAPGVIDLSHWELSDVPAWALTALALWASTHLVGSPEAERDADERRHGRWLAIFLVALVLGNFTRSAGLPLVVAAVAWLALRRRWRDLAILAAAFLPFAFAWWLWGKTHGAPGYLSHLWAVDPYKPALGNMTAADLLQRILRNISRYVTIHLPVLLTWDEGRPILAGAVIVAAVAGWTRRLSRPGLAELWTPLYLGLVLVWPSTWSGERFLLPLMPLFFLYAGEVVRDVAGAMGSPAMTRLVGAITAAAMFLVALPGTVRVVATGRACSAAYRAGESLPCLNDPFHDLLAIAEKTRGALPEGSVVISRKPTLFYALSGYPGRTYPLSASPDTFFATARSIGAKYVVYDAIPDLAPMYLYPVLEARRDDFCVIPGLTLPNAAVLRIEEGSPVRTGVPENAVRYCPDATPPPPR